MAKAKLKSFRFKTVKVPSIQEPILSEDERDELGQFKYPWHNIVFEGGGNKGLAYAGSVRVLEEIGVWDQVKRIAGTSAGAMTAGLLAVGYNSYDLEAFLKQPDLEKIFLDARFGVLSVLPNFLKRFGWHPGNKLYSWFGKMIQKKTGNPDSTFEEVYNLFGKELCICVTNVNFLDCYYCHVKTTPDLPVRMAMRMSGSIPGVFCTVKNTLSSFPDHYIDGGLLVNYPIHAFDGWYLSMRPENTFLKKIQPLRDIRKLWDRKERFGHKNERTLGMLLYSNFEPEVMKDALNDRSAKYLDYSQKVPTTKLSKKRLKKMNIAHIESQHDLLVDAMDSLMAEMNIQDRDGDGSISLEEFKRVYDSTESKFSDEHKKLLFGEDGLDSDKIFEKLDFDKNGEISFRELVYWAEKRGLKLLSAFRGYDRREVTTMMEFFSTMMDCLLLNMKRIFIQDNDLYRTVGIDCVYLDAMDFKMEHADQQFLIQQGKLGCIAYIREFIAKFKPSQKPKMRVNERARDSKKLHRVTLEVARALNSESDLEGMYSPSPPSVGPLGQQIDDDVFSAQLQEANIAAQRKKTLAAANAELEATPTNVRSPRSVLFEDEVQINVDGDGEETKL
ncbi:uncharacterized protein [Asterias amurensis]|uniref:uncharacterized protein n=1 Tax=Asterias amurensis TaxID=7602 RepID=UPI003AB6908F